MTPTEIMAKAIARVVVKYSDGAHLFPGHAHRVQGRWDGGKICEECVLWRQAIAAAHEVITSQVIPPMTHDEMIEETHRRR